MDGIPKVHHVKVLGARTLQKRPSGCSSATSLVNASAFGARGPRPRDEKIGPSAPKTGTPHGDKPPTMSGLLQNPRRWESQLSSNPSYGAGSSQIPAKLPEGQSAQRTRTHVITGIESCCPEQGLYLESRVRDRGPRQRRRCHVRNRLLKSSIPASKVCTGTWFKLSKRSVFGTCWRSIVSLVRRRMSSERESLVQTPGTLGFSQG